MIGHQKRKKGPNRILKFFRSRSSVGAFSDRSREGGPERGAGNQSGTK